jgi:hypothetical protein
MSARTAIEDEVYRVAAGTRVLGSNWAESCVIYITNLLYKLAETLIAGSCFWFSAPDYRGHASDKSFGIFCKRVGVFC